jgi:hypothetical protein
MAWKVRAGLAFPGGGTVTVKEQYVTTQSAEVNPWYRRTETFNSPGPPYIQENNFYTRKLSMGYADTYGRHGTSVYNGWKFRPILWNYIGQVDPALDVDPSAYQAEIMSRLNPNNAIVNVPLFIFELKDVPRMLRDIFRFRLGKGAPSDVPGQYLAYNFGWAPLISDLRKLAMVADLWEQRVAFLNRAKTEGVNLSLGRETKTRNVSSGINIKGSIPCPIEQVANWRIWASARLTPDSQIPTPGTNLAWQVARGLQKGLTYDTMYQAIPWSWLIDYLGNIGSIMQARSGRLKYTVNHVCVMTQATITETADYSYVKAYRPGLEIAPHDQVHEIKRRRVIGVPNLIPRWEKILSNHQASILGSIALSGVMGRKDLRYDDARPRVGPKPRKGPRP